MKFDIIQTDYIKNIKGVKKIFIPLAIIVLISIALKYLGIVVFENSKLLSFIFTIVFGLYFLIEILNHFLLARIGVIHFTESNISIEKEGSTIEYKISDIQKVTLRSHENKKYKIKASPIFEEVIELEKTDLVSLEEYFTVNKVDYKHISLNNWIMRFFGRNYAE